MVALTGDTVGVIAEAACAPVASKRTPAIPAQAETADITDHQNV